MQRTIGRIRQGRCPSTLQILDCLTATTLPGNPLQTTLPEEVGLWPEELRLRVTQNLTAAGVLIPIIERADNLSVLFTRRSAHLRYHAGQVSFPGGRMEPGDADILATALRETREEVGIDAQHVRIAGFLPPLPIVSGYAVTPVVGLVSGDTPHIADPAEVERIFEVPLEFLLDPANQQRSMREVMGVQVPVCEFHYASERIWGATASILLRLRTALDNSL
ncbi:MAG TPA: CoA pyrophosphatase [Woeseiaceae bacterium]